MGNCLEFAVTITAGCEHPMVAQSDCCVCEVCGTRCTGRFGGCPAVWAATTAPQPLAMAENGHGGNGAVLAAPLAAIDADLAINWAHDAPVPATAVHDARLEKRAYGRRTQDKHRRIGALVAVVALVGAGIGVLLATRGGADNGVRVAAARPPELQFKTVAISDSVELDRNWRLEGTGGHRFIGTLTFSNSADTVSPVVYDETLPKSLADNVNVVLFNPYPVVIKADPVFEYQLQIDPHSSVTVTYEISVPPDGLDAKRLDQWSKDVQDELDQRVADAQAALTAAKTASEQAAARAFLAAAQQARRSFKPTPHASGCVFACGGGGSTGGGGGGGVTSTTDCSTNPNGCPPPLLTTTTQPPTTTTEPPTTTTEATTTPTEPPACDPETQICP